MPEVLDVIATHAVQTTAPPVAQSPGISQILQKPRTWSMRYALKYWARCDSRRFHLADTKQQAKQMDRGQADTRLRHTCN